MDTSVILIGLAITAVIVLPLYKMMRSNQVSKNRIKAIMAQHPSYKFLQVETQNKRTYAIDTERKGFLLIDFNPSPEKVTFVDLKDVASCKIIQSTGNTSGQTTQIALEFSYKDSAKLLVPVYQIEFDQITQVCMYEDQELATRWQQQIAQTLTQ